MTSSVRVAAVVRLSETVEELVGEAVIVSLKTVDVVVCAEGRVVVMFKASCKIEDERDAGAVIVALGAFELCDRVEF